MGIETMTVHMGLVKASLLSIILLTSGGILTATAFLLEFAYGLHPLLSVFILSIPVAVFVVLRKFKNLYSLSKEYVASDSQSSVGEEIVSLSAYNPQWIMLITQSYSLVSIMLLVGKFLL